jgi:hypothetical protein
MEEQNAESKKRPVFCKICKNLYYCNSFDVWPVASADKRCIHWELADEDDEISRRQNPEV